MLRYPGRITAQAGPLAEERLGAALERARREGGDSFPEGGYLAGCGCSTSKIAVRPDGT